MNEINTSLSIFASTHSEQGVNPDATALENKPKERKLRRLNYSQSDAGNADRILDVYGSSLRYCPETRCIWVYREGRWTRDEEHVERLAEECIRKAEKAAYSLEQGKDRDKLLKFCTRSLSQQSIQSAVKAVRRKLKRISITEFDQNPRLLNFNNGTVNLETGVLHDHRPQDLITKRIPFDFDPGAQAARFLLFLDEITGRDVAITPEAIERAEEIKKYLQLACGCAATGIPEKTLFILVGAGDNGKTKFVEAIRLVLGDGEYAGEIKVETLLAHKYGSSNATAADIADLRGKRFVTSSEIDDTQTLLLGLVKSLTGGGQLRGRHMRENFFNFQATHKLFLDCNDPPVINSAQDAVWNRIACVPFEVTIPKEKQDKNLIQQFASEQAGIARWIVEGAVKYLAKGLPKAMPVPVAAATEKYRTESDHLTEFLADEYEITGDESDQIPIREVWRSYQEWVRESGDLKPLSKRKFRAQLESKGVVYGHNSTSDTRVWRGIRRRVDSSDDLTGSDDDFLESLKHS